MNGQIEYGSVRPLTSGATPVASRRPGRPGHVAAARRATALGLLAAGGVLLTLVLIALPRPSSEPGLFSLLGLAWVAIVLAVTLPSRAPRRVDETPSRLARFRHAVNTVGDTPTRAQLMGLLAMTQQLGLLEDDVANEVGRIQASLDALALTDEMACGRLPVVTDVAGLPPGTTCHFSTFVRYGRRRSDQCGQLVFTTGWLKFLGTVELGVAWTEVANVERAGTDLIVTLEDRRALRFSCQSDGHAARGGVIAQYLRRLAHPAISARPEALGYPGSV